MAELTEDPSTALTLPGDPGAAPGGEGEPRQFGRFSVDRRLGAGGMGVVYAGRDPELRRQVAIKALHRGSPDRLMREAQALAKLDHPNVVQIYEVGREGEQVYIAMQLVQGRELTQWLRESDRSWKEIVEMFVAAGRGLAAAHARGLVHRDFKPDNVLVGNDEVPRVLDFGLARARGEAKPSQPAVIPDGDVLMSPLTQTGATMGTPAYMSPEQFAGAEATAASDQFSFCVALYEALYGERPFAGDSFAAIAFAVEMEQVRPATAQRDVPTWLRAALLRGLRKTASSRHGSMDELLRELTSFRDTTLAVGRRARVAFVSTSMTVLILLLGSTSVYFRVQGIQLTLAHAMILSGVSVAAIGVALWYFKDALTRSGMSSNLFWSFVAYLFFGPVFRFVGGMLEIPMPKVLLLELVGTALYGALVALAFDHRLLKMAPLSALYVLLLFPFWDWALEIHTLGHLVLFGLAGLIWMRDGFAPPPGVVARRGTNPGVTP